MPFEIVGLDFVGREGREEDMAGIDGNTFIGRNRPPRIAKASTGIENARNLVKTFMRDHGLNDRPAHVRSFNGDFLFRSGPRKSRQYYRVVNGTVSKTTADLKLGSPPMAGVDGDVFIGGKKSPIEQARSIALAYKKKNKLYGPVAYLKSDPSIGDYVFSVGRAGSIRYIRVLNGTASLSRKQPKLGSPPSVSGWWPFSRQMTPQEAEQKAENIMRKQNIQMGQGNIVSAKDLANSIVAASKELGGQEIAKGYVLTVLIRKGMGFMDSQGQTHWPSFAPQKA